MGTDPKMVLNQHTIQVKSTNGNKSNPLKLQTVATANNGRPHVYIGTTSSGKNSSQGNYQNHESAVHIFTQSIAEDPGDNSCYAVKVHHDTTDDTHIDAGNFGGIQIMCGVSDADAVDSNGCVQWMNFLDNGGHHQGSIRYSASDNGAALVAGSDERIKYDIADSKVNAVDLFNGFKMKEYRRNISNSPYRS